MATRRNTPTPQPQLDRSEDAPEPGQLGAQLATTRAAQVGQDMAERYAAIGARWLADPLPTRLDSALIDRLAAQGFRRDRLAEIRVHRGSRAQAAADALDARAFAVGDADVFFAPGQYDPSTTEGRAVIAHEVAHVAPPTHARGLPGAAAMPVLNERGRNDDSSDGEAAERVARDAEARVFAQESQGAAPALASSPAAAAAAQVPAKRAPIDPHVLEDKVLALLERMQRTEGERSGHT